jgi:hypothetical protein
VTIPTKATAPGELIESVLIKGDLAVLTEKQRTDYYMAVCQSLGLNHLTKPFSYIKLNGALRLYALKDCTDQLRKINGVSLAIVSKDEVQGMLSYHVRAVDKTGRSDEDIGMVAFADELKGENRANAAMKAVTKAKRRVTLSISGLGFLDESEIDPAERRPSAPAPNVMRPVIPPSQAVVPPPVPLPGPDAVAQPAGESTPLEDSPAGPSQENLEVMAREAAQRGVRVFNAFYKNLSELQQQSLLQLQPELKLMMGKAPKDSDDAA